MGSLEIPLLRGDNPPKKPAYFDFEFQENCLLSWLNPLIEVPCLEFSISINPDYVYALVPANFSLCLLQFQQANKTAFHQSDHLRLKDSQTSHMRFKRLLAEWEMEKDRSNPLARSLYKTFKSKSSPRNSIRKC